MIPDSKSPSPYILGALLGLFVLLILFMFGAWGASCTAPPVRSVDVPKAKAVVARREADAMRDEAAGIVQEIAEDRQRINGMTAEEIAAEFTRIYNERNRQ